MTEIERLSEEIKSLSERIDSWSRLINVKVERIEELMKKNNEEPVIMALRKPAVPENFNYPHDSNPYKKEHLHIIYDELANLRKLIEAQGETIEEIQKPKQLRPEDLEPLAKEEKISERWQS